MDIMFGSFMAVIVLFSRRDCATDIDTHFMIIYQPGIPQINTPTHHSLIMRLVFLVQCCQSRLRKFQEILVPQNFIKIQKI